MKYLAWDFDGTLGYRTGMWSSALLEVAAREAPEMDLSPEHFKPHLQTGFPWHAPAQLHPELSIADEWWEALHGTFRRAFHGVGFDADRADALAREVRGVYVDPRRWRLFDDALPTLALLSNRGWRHFILSNHVPELSDLVAHLGLGTHVERVFNSAVTGYEKPNPEAFRSVLDAISDAATVWMVGDSFRADVRGARSAGIPAILVRRPHEGAELYCRDLSGVPELVGG